MNRLEKIKKVKKRIEDNKIALERLTDTYLSAFAPAGYKGGSSYNDYDTIHGGNKELRLEDFAKEKERIETLIILDKGILERYEKENEEEEYLKELCDIKDKILYLRKVCGYTQNETAKILNLSKRQIQRLDTKMSPKKSL